MDEAYNMAVDALGLGLTNLEKNKISFPTPSPVHQITVDDDAFVVEIKLDMMMV